MMIMTAALAMLAPSPILKEGVPVAYEIKGERKSGAVRIIMLPHQLGPIMTAIEQGGGQQLVVSVEKTGRMFLNDAQDDTLRAALKEANARKLAAEREADPLAFALGDLAWAEMMARCARADVIRHGEPQSHVDAAEAEVARLTKIVLDMTPADI